MRTYTLAVVALLVIVFGLFASAFAMLLIAAHRVDVATGTGADRERRNVRP